VITRFRRQGGAVMNSSGNVCDRNGVALCHKAVIDRLRAELGLEDALVAEQREYVTTGHYAAAFEKMARLLVHTDLSYREVALQVGGKTTKDAVRDCAKWLRKGGVPFKQRDDWKGWRKSNPLRLVASPSQERGDDFVPDMLVSATTLWRRHGTTRPY
jgi:hypothetical protein